MAPLLGIVILALFLAPPSARGEEKPALPPGPRPLQEIFMRQDPPKVVPRLLDGADPSQTSIYVSLARQRAYLFVGKEVAIDTPVSSGKPRAMTPKGQFVVQDKKSSASSRFFGDYTDRDSRVVRSAVSTSTDAAPSGTTFRAVPLPYYIGLDKEGVALHAGPLPGYPASDTSVRLPADIAPLFFQRVKIGTPVKIGD